VQEDCFLQVVSHGKSVEQRVTDISIHVSKQDNGISCVLMGMNECTKIRKESVAWAAIMMVCSEKPSVLCSHTPDLISSVCAGLISKNDDKLLS